MTHTPPRELQNVDDKLQLRRLLQKQDRHLEYNGGQGSVDWGFGVGGSDRQARMAPTTF